MTAKVHAGGQSARQYAQGRTRGEARLAAFRKHPLRWSWRRIVPRRGLSERYEPPSDPAVILDRLAKLPISLWTYGWDHPSVRHLGPMSQDFAAAFGLGWYAEGMDPVDCNGVLTVAVQELVKRVARLEAELAELRTTGSEIEHDVMPVGAADTENDTEGNMPRIKLVSDGIDEGDDTGGNRFSSSDAEIKHDVTPVGDDAESEDTEGNRFSYSDAEIKHDVTPVGDADEDDDTEGNRVKIIR